MSTMMVAILETVLLLMTYNMSWMQNGQREWEIRGRNRALYSATESYDSCLTLCEKYVNSVYEFGIHF